MNQLHSSLIIFNFFKEKFERDHFLIEFSVTATKKYGKRYKDLIHFNKDLKESLFLKQVIDICSFLDEFKAFRSLAKDNEKVKEICKQVKPALKRIEEVKGLRAYRNVLAAHNFRHEKNKEEVILLSDYSTNPDYPNSLAEIFFLSALCSTIIEAVSTKFKSELQQAIDTYSSRLEDDRSDPLRGIKSLQEAYDEVDKYRIELNLQPKFLENEFAEFNMALGKLNWDAIPSHFKLSKYKTNKAWSGVLGIYLQMRGYQDIDYVQGRKGNSTCHWLELYGYAMTITDKLYADKPDGIRKVHDSITYWNPKNEEGFLQRAQPAYEEIMKVVAP